MASFFFNDTATAEIYTLSLHDALPISPGRNSRVSVSFFQNLSFPELKVVSSAGPSGRPAPMSKSGQSAHRPRRGRDRKSTRLNSSHANISYAVFCLKKNILDTYTPRTM